MFNGKTHYKWPFSLAMLVYQRVHCFKATVMENMMINPEILVFPPDLRPNHITHFPPYLGLSENRVYSQL